MAIFRVFSVFRGEKELKLSTRLPDDFAGFENGSVAADASGPLGAIFFAKLLDAG